MTSGAGSPLVVVVSGPSGVGKDALLARIRERTDIFGVPVTMTTRAPRPGEVDGRDYIFTTREAFERTLAEGGLVEHAEVYGNLYGVPRAQLRSVLDAGRDVIMRVDVQGAATLRQVLPGALFIFLAPPDEGALLERLRGRGEDAATIERRLAYAPDEIDLATGFDHTVVNRDGDLDAAVDEVLALVEAERARPGRTPISL